MSVKNLLVVLSVIAMPFILGQMCTSAPETTPVVNSPDVPLVIYPSVVEPPIAASPIGISPTDPVATPSVITTPVVVPPVTLPEPPAWQPKIIAPVTEMSIRQLEYVLASSETAYAWTHLYECPSTMPPRDPWGDPDPTVLVSEYDGMISVNSHHIFFRPNLPWWPRQITEVKLELYCLENKSTLHPGGLGTFFLKSDWPLPAPDPTTWKMYCGNNFPDRHCVLDPLAARSTKAGEWYSVDLTYIFQNWVWDYVENHGIMLQNGGWSDWSVFASPAHSNAEIRPRLIVNYEPSLRFKLPLPGNKAWILTVQKNGTYCGGLDSYHYGRALDFASSSAEFSRTGKVVTKMETDVPILAAADGVVIEAKEDDGMSPNGSYVKVKHQLDFVSCYLHLEGASLMVKVGDCVAQGCQLGLMGTTGNSTGVHLHFEIQWPGQDGEAAERLTEVTIEGHSLEDFQVDCEGGNYYASTNAP